MLLLDLFFPPQCTGCRKELAQGALCVDCEKLFPAPAASRCPHCNARIPRQALAPACQKALHFEKFTTIGPYRHPLLRATIDALKYEGIRDLAKPLGLHLATRLKALTDSTLREEYLLVPVPLHPQRLRERGYNQSELLAGVIGKKLNIEISTTLSRFKPTLQQARISREQRDKNVQNAFTAKPERSVPARTIILIDDVVTSGATMREASQALRRAGARKIWAAAVAQG